jgi:hypothetical protein
MLAKAREYQERARDCVRMANEADSEEARDKLLEVARAWMDAALVEIEEEGRDEEGAVLLTPAGVGTWPVRKSDES